MVNSRFCEAEHVRYYGQSNSFFFFTVINSLQSSPSVKYALRNVNSATHASLMFWLYGHCEAHSARDVNLC